MIIHIEDVLKYDVQWSIKTIQRTQHAITSENLTQLELSLAQLSPSLFSLLDKDVYLAQLLSQSVPNA